MEWRWVALDRLIEVIYPDLRRIAHCHLLRRRAGESVESAALVDEAYLKLAGAGGIRCENRVHFLTLCSQIMRRILVDDARRRGFAKRGGHAVFVALDEALADLSPPGWGLSHTGAPLIMDPRQRANAASPFAPRPQPVVPTKRRR